MEDNVSKIKDRLDIVDVVGSYMKLQKAGVNWKGRCPFHNEKTPSFFVTPERQIWHCFGCAKGGDMFEFVKEIEGVEFPEAMKILATRAGIELVAFSREQSVQRDAKTRLYEICELAAKFFQKQFESSTGKKALQYLRDRGLTDDTAQEFRLGFAPNDWESLSKYLHACGYNDSEIVDAGMAIRSEKKRDIYDRFRSRIMFPVTDISGQVVGFSGRVFEAVDAGVDKTPESGAKYVNTPSTLIYDKSRVLYGLSQAKLDIKKADRCILVEGNMDALMSFQAGVHNVVASSGTALTLHHLRLLQRYTKNLGFCFDTDQAGSAATRRGIGLALGQQFDVRVIAIDDSECKDPADYIRKHAQRWSNVVMAAKPAVEYWFDRARAVYNPTSPESKRAVLVAVAPFVKRLASNVERSHWVSQLAALFRAPEAAVQADLAALKDELGQYIDSEGGGRSEGKSPEATETALKAVSPPDILNEAILSIALKYPPVLKEVGVPYELLDSRTADAVRRIANSAGEFSFPALVAEFPGSTAMHLEFANLRAQELWQDFDAESLTMEFRLLVAALRRRALSARLASLQFDLKEAESKNDRAAVVRLIAEFDGIASQLNDLHQTFEEKTKKDPETRPIELSGPEEASKAGQTSPSAE